MKIIKQDILQIKEGVVCHQVNCMGVYGGLAGAIFRKYPEAKKSYKNLTDSAYKRWDMLGDTQLVRINNDLTIANMFAQYDVGVGSRKTEYGSFRYCIETIVSNVAYPYPKIYFPYLIGCGLGGGEWDVIADIIESTFWQDWDVYICRMD